MSESKPRKVAPKVAEEVDHNLTNLNGEVQPNHTSTVNNKTAYKRKRNIVFYYWSPTPLVASMGLVWLKFLPYDKAKHQCLKIGRAHV